MPTYTPGMETVPALRQHMIAWRSTCTRSLARNAAAFTLSRVASEAPWPDASQPTASMQADRKVGDLGAEFDHLAHILMTEYVSALHGWLIAVEEMKVGTADRAGRDFNDCVARMP